MLYSSQNDRILSAYRKRFLIVERNYNLPIIMSCFRAITPNCLVLLISYVGKLNVSELISSGTKTWNEIKSQYPRKRVFGYQSNNSLEFLNNCRLF